MFDKSMTPEQMYDYLVEQLPDKRMWQDICKLSDEYNYLSRLLTPINRWTLDSTYDALLWSISKETDGLSAIETEKHMLEVYQREVKSLREKCIKRGLLPDTSTAHD